MKKIIALLCCFIIAQTIVFANAISVNDSNYYVLAKIIRDIDKSVEAKEFDVTKKLIQEIKAIGFFSDITDITQNSKKRIEILELQISELQYQIEENNKRNKKQPAHFTKSPNIEEEKEQITTQYVPSELDEASSDGPVNFDK